MSLLSYKNLGSDQDETQEYESQVSNCTKLEERYTI